MELENDKKRYDRTYAQIDLGAIRHNIAVERARVGADVKIMAVIKANAYGHGDIEVAEALDDQVDAYGVAIPEEALKLRKNGVKKMLLILGYSGKDWFEDIIQEGISQTVYSYSMAKQLSDTAVNMGKSAKIHIKIDTGMSRIGFMPVKDNIDVIRAIRELPGIEIEGAFTHFARADEETSEAAREPFEKYMIFLRELEKRGVHIPIRHAANSASIIQFPESQLDMVRSGITTYGLYPSEKVSRDILHLNPALQWKSQVSFVKRIHPGTSVGYGGTFTASRETVVATIPVGYADGVKRDLSGKGHVLIRGQYAPILGKICMDQFMVDVTEIDGVSEGDTVTLIGTDGEHVISVEEVAALSHSFNYEYVCGISERVPRKYIN
ncbi:MAG: alanine racemase [Eubacterium sp.]|jgi:alanine racemase|nr:alanine racemase [Eubacterium sp.]